MTVYLVKATRIGPGNETEETIEKVYDSEEKAIKWCEFVSTGDEEDGSWPGIDGRLMSILPKEVE